MNQSFVAAINAATSYKPIVDPLRLARLYNRIQSGLTLPPACFLICMLECTSIIMVFTMIIIAKSMQYQLFRHHVTTKNCQSTKLANPPKRFFTGQDVSTLPTMQITMLATSKDQYQNPNFFSVDTDGVYFIIINSANGGICNIKSILNNK